MACVQPRYTKSICYSFNDLNFGGPKNKKMNETLITMIDKLGNFANTADLNCTNSFDVANTMLIDAIQIYMHSEGRIRVIAYDVVENSDDKTIKVTRNARFVKNINEIRKCTFMHLFELCETLANVANRKLGSYKNPHTIRVMNGLLYTPHESKITIIFL